MSEIAIFMLYVEQKRQILQHQLQKLFNLNNIEMGLAFNTSNKMFFFLGLVLQIWFCIIYALDYGYKFLAVGTSGQELGYGFLSIQGFLLVLFLLLLFFLGFSLVNTYVAGSAYSSALFSFLIIVFTIQYYFIIRSFWVGIGLGNDNYDYTLGSGPYYMIRLHSNDWRLNSSYTTEYGMTDAIVCALAMLVAYMAIAGRVGGFHVIILCFFGVFFYGFNEIVTWRHAISDNGYTMRLFLFGSTFGAATAFILRFKDKISTTNTLGYFASRHTRTYGLLGACFVWLFLPILSCLNTLYDLTLSQNTLTYLTPSILNLWFALSASCSISFCISILLGRKIHPHDIVFSSFSGGIAYGATSTLNPDPFPAILCGLITGTIVTILNHKLKKPLNNPDVIDTQGTLYTFFASALIGGIYSAILSAVYPYSSEIPTSVNTWAYSNVNQWLPYDRSKITQGGLQMAAVCWSIGIGLLSSIAVAFILYFTTELTADEIFNDATFAEVSDDHEKVDHVEPPRRD